MLLHFNFSFPALNDYLLTFLVNLASVASSDLLLLSPWQTIVLAIALSLNENK